MGGSGRFEVIRDPLWNNIRADPEALSILDTPTFQRLRYVRQLGHAFLVYPGATHSRFEHALGTYHLAGRCLTLLRDRNELDGVPPEETRLLRLAALLHDVGHYPFSHSLEEAGLPSHEGLAAARLGESDLARALEEFGIPDAAARIGRLISGRSESPLQGLISGTLDLDKIEYLTRDARMCGVPYGTVDVDRLLHSMTLVTYRGQLTLGVHEKGLSALESLMFAKYQMYRNVYWHHAVRSATVMFKRLVRDVMTTAELAPSWIARTTDESLMERLKGSDRLGLARRLQSRLLYKRSLDLPARTVSADQGRWISGDPILLAAVEDHLAEELGRAQGEILLDFPHKAELVAARLPVHTRKDTIEPLNGETGSSLIEIQRIADDLHDSARRLRVFTPDTMDLDERMVLEVVQRSGDDLRDELGLPARA